MLKEFQHAGIYQIIYLAYTFTYNYDLLLRHLVILTGGIYYRQVGQGKGKGHPRTGHEGPEGEQMYISTLSLTSALDGVVVSATPWPL